MLPHKPTHFIRSHERLRVFLTLFTLFHDCATEILAKSARNFFGRSGVSQRVCIDRADLPKSTFSPFAFT